MPSRFDISTAQIVPEYLDEIALSHFRLLLRAFHVPIREMPCKAEYLEELFCSAFKHRYPDTTVSWDAGSHRAGEDITIIEHNIGNRTLLISVKTGDSKGKNEIIKVSGYRLQKQLNINENDNPILTWSTGGQDMIDWLNENLNP